MRWICRTCGCVWESESPETCPSCSSFMIMPSASHSSIQDRCLNETKCLIRMTDAMLDRLDRPQSPTFLRAAKGILSITNSFKKLGVKMDENPLYLDPVLRSIAEDEKDDALAREAVLLTPRSFNHRKIQRREQREGVVCPICYEDLKCGEAVCELPCKHVFHDNCVRGWFRHNSHTCPVCRAQLTEEQEAHFSLRSFVYLFA